MSNRKFILLPHYSLKNKELLFLGKEKIRLSNEEINFLLNGKITDYRTPKILNQKGIITDITVKNNNKNIEQLIIEPHCDDAALSIGGYLLKNIDTGKILLNVFSTCGCTILQNYLKDPKEITFYNNKEEELFASKINTQLKMMHLQESFFRYDNWNAPFNKNKDMDLINKVEEEIYNYLENNTINRIFFPLSIGNHPDHSLIFHIFNKMNSVGAFISKSVFLYEDLPYAAEQKWIIGDYLSDRKLNLSPVLVDITKEIRDKIDLVSIYKTQYSHKDLQILKDYASKIFKNDKFFERLWEVKK